MRSIAIVNQKGGCGKTVTAINLASSLADAGERVLLVDCDPQSHASIGLGIATDELGSSMYDVFMDHGTSIHEVAQPVMERLYVAPSNVVLSAVEQQLSGQPDREKRLARKLVYVEHDFDYIIVDCPPSVGLLTFNAIVACREQIVVMEPSYFSLHGALKVLESINLVREQLGVKRHVKMLLTMFERQTNFSKEFLEEARLRFGRGMFETVIRKTVRFKEATNWGVAIAHYCRSSGGARDYTDLAREVIAGGQSVAGDFQSVTEVEGVELDPSMDEWILAQPGPRFIDDGVLFSLIAPEANDVRLLGDFNNWDTETGIRLRRNGNGVWHTTVDLAPGRYLYKFLIDGVWRPDPANDNRTAPNGDCVIEVGRRD